jgi:phage tail tape-measure protein
VAKLKLDLILNDKGMVVLKKFGTTTGKVMRNAERSVAGFASRLASVHSLIATTAAAIGGWKLAESFIEASSTAEQYQVRLRALLGSTAEGNRLFKEMADYAGQVSFEYEQIMGSATALAGVMKGGVDEISRWMPLIGDLAAVTGLSIEDTTSQVIRMYSAGAAAADMFRERGVLSMLGFQAGVKYTAEETREIMFREWQKADSQFRGVTKDLGTSWKGLLSMMSDQWFTFRTQFMADSGLFDYIKSLMSTLLGQVREFRDQADFSTWAKEAGEKIIAGFESAVLGVARFYDTAMPILTGIKDEAKDLWNVYKDNIPEWAQPYGLLGAIFMGKKGVAGLTAYTWLIGKANEMADNIRGEREKGELLGTKLIRGFVEGEEKLQNVYENLQKKRRGIELPAVHSATMGPPLVASHMAGVADTATEVAKQMDSAEKATKSFLDRAKEVFGDLRTGADQAEKSTKKFGSTTTDVAKASAKELAKLGKAYKDVTLAMLPEHDRAIERIKRQYDALRDQAKLLYETSFFNAADLAEYEVRLTALSAREQEAIAAAKKGLEEKKNKTNEYFQAWRHMLDNMHDAGADFFYDWFSGADSGFKNLMDRFKDYFYRMLAELAALAIARPITISIIGSVAGGLGLDAISSAVGGGGLGTGLSIFSTLKSGLSGGFDSIGSLLSWEWIQDGAMAMVNFSDSLDGIAHAFSDLGAFIEKIPLIGDLGLGGTLQGINALINLSEGDIGGAVMSGIGAGLAYINPILGGAWALGSWLGDALFGKKKAPEPPWFQVSQHTLGWNEQKGALRNLTGFTTKGAFYSDDPAAIQQNIIKAWGQTWNSWSDTIKMLRDTLGDVGQEWMEKVKEVRISSGAYFKGFDFTGQDLVNALNRQIYTGMVPLFNDLMDMVWVDAKREFAQTDAWGYMSEGWISNINKMVVELPRLAAGGDPAEEMEKVQQFMQEIQGIQVWMAGVAELTTKIDLAVRGDSVSGFEKAWLSVNAQFDLWTQQLIEMGVDLTKYTTLEEGRQKALSDLYGGAFTEIQDVIDQYSLSEQAYRIKKGLPEIQKWYDEQLAMMDFLRGGGRLSEMDYITHLADLNRAMAYKAQDLQSSFNAAVVSLEDFFNEMSISDLAPALSLETFKNQYQQLLSGGLTQDLLDFVKSDYLPFLKTYTGAGEDYNVAYGNIMSDLQGLKSGSGNGGLKVEFDPNSLTQALYNAIMAVKAEGGSTGEMHFHIMIDGEVIAHVVNDQIDHGNIILT